MQLDICDDEGYEFSTEDSVCEIFYEPFLRIDQLADKEVEPDIRVYDEIGALDDLKFILYAKPLTKKECWTKRQKYKLFLMKEDGPVEKTFKKLRKIPSNHFVEVDIANYKFRLVGDFISPNKNATGWIYY